MANLRTLENLAGQDGRPGDAESLHSMLVLAIDVTDMLPPAVARHFNRAAFMVGGQHEQGPAQRRIDLWRPLAAKLGASLDAVAADNDLTIVTTGERRRTCGERVQEICGELARAFSRGGDYERLVTTLEQEASGTPAAGDVREMRRLLAMKRIPDENQWRYDFHRAIAHADRIGAELHGQPARTTKR